MQNTDFNSQEFFTLELAPPDTILHPVAVRVGFDLDALDIDLRRPHIFMTQRFLRDREALRVFGDDPGERVTELVQVKVIKAGAFGAAAHLLFLV